ncbi:MAG: hypothetical protein SGJ27_23365 [Candidatus Melainabacteria bacterium]|nr:hypothetical protein [Candidatus Melainabacteria bacterium]
MARNQNAKQINFIPADDIAEELASCENKTKVINEALRMYFASGPLRLDIIERLQKLEDFQTRFMAYYARKDNEPHSEFCDCQSCANNRQTFASTRTVPLDPEPQTFEKVLSVIQRAVDQATRMNASVVFETGEYKFRITANSNVDDEYKRYLEFVGSGQSISFTIPNPWLK